MICKAAIVGLGRIASLLEDDSRREKPCTHAGAISTNGNCKLVAGCDIAEERRGLFAKRWSVPVYSDAKEMIQRQNPEILVVATHPDSHYYYCRLAAAHSVPVVVCEKPLADTLFSARKIAKQDVTIITNHERRYSADYLKAKNILATYKLGTILSIRAVIYMGMNKRLLDVLWHDGTHLADAIMFLTGLALKHRRHWGAKLNQTSGTAWLQGEMVSTGAESIPVIIEIGAKRDHLAFELEFSCTKGRLRIGNGIFEIWESGESPYAEKFRSLVKTCGTFEGPTAYFSNMIADAVSCVLEPGRKPVSSAGDGLAVIEYLHSVKTWRLFGN